MNLDNLSPELKAKALECKTSEEFLKLAENEGMELSDEQLEAVSGGGEWGCTRNDPGMTCTEDW